MIHFERRHLFYLTPPTSPVFALIAQAFDLGSCFTTSKSLSHQRALATVITFFFLQDSLSQAYVSFLNHLDAVDDGFSCSFRDDTIVDV